MALLGLLLLLAVVTPTIGRGGDFTTSVVPGNDVRPRPKLGFGNEFIFQTSRDAGMNEALSTAGSELCRFPGGTPSDYWLWSDGWVNRTSDQSRSAQLPVRPTTVEELHAYVQAANTAMRTCVMVLNQLQTNVSYQVRGLHAHHDAGTEVLFVELGNEMYDSTRPDVLAAYPEPRDYAEQMASWTKAIKADFPAAQVALVGLANEWDNRTEVWNAQVLQNPISQQADAATIHLYPGIASGPLTPDTVPGILALGASNVEGYRAYTDATIPARFRLWVTEWGTWGNTDLYNTWLQGLVHMAHMLLLPTAMPRLDIILPYCAVCGDPAMASFTSQYGPIEPVNATPAAQWNRTGSGHAYALLFNAVRNTSHVASATFSTNPVLDGKVPNSRALVGLFFFSQNTSTTSIAHSLIFANLGSAAADVQLGGVQFDCGSSEDARRGDGGAGSARGSTGRSVSVVVVDVFYPSVFADLTRQHILVEDLGHTHLVAPASVSVPPYSIAVASCT